jgi:hypothetical protein
MNPEAAVKSMLGTGWGSDPFDAAGRLIPQVVLAAATDGAGTAADAAEDAAVSAGEDAGRAALGGEGDATTRAASDAASDGGTAARSESEVPAAGDPVDVATGDVVMFATDVVLSSALPLRVERAYRSSLRAGRWFGPGWASTLDQRVTVLEDRIIGVFGDGRILTWPVPARWRTRCCRRPVRAGRCAGMPTAPAR